MVALLHLFFMFFFFKEAKLGSIGGVMRSAGRIYLKQAERESGGKPLAMEEEERLEGNKGL